MSHLNTKNWNWVTQLLPVLLAAVAVLLGASAYAAVPGITGVSHTPSFSLTASEDFITQPDGQMVYSWGYGCTSRPSDFRPTLAGQTCPLMQIPGPTLIVTEGDNVTVTLTNSLPPGAGNTSILFPGFQVIASAVDTTLIGPKAGLLTTEAAPGGTVTYSFTATTPGTHAYYSGTQSDLQIEMGLYGALIVLPNAPVPVGVGGCTKNNGDTASYSLSTSAYDNLPASCYDREYLFQLAEMDPRIHRQAEEQVQAAKAAVAGGGTASPLNVATEPYHPNYFLVNGRSMPDDMDANFAPPYPHQPYNGNPHMHPGDQVLLRVIGVGRWQHPFHEHGNHVRILARDGNLLLSQTDSKKLAGPLLFTTTTTPGLAMDGIFYWSGRGLNWDVYGHKPGDGSACSPDLSGYYTAASPIPAALPGNFSQGLSTLGAPNYYEWCADHNKALETYPVGNVGSGGPVTLPDPLILTNGLWYGGTPYLGPVATLNAGGSTPVAPGKATQNPNAGFAFMWHSHNEREITTNDVFPGGMMMMMIVDAPYVQIDETL